MEAEANRAKFEDWLAQAKLEAKAQAEADRAQWEEMKPVYQAKWAEW